MRSGPSLLLLLIAFASAASAQDARQQDPPQSDVPQKVQVGSGVESGNLLRKVNPTYPPLARQARIQGTVVLKAFINKKGDVVSLQLISGHPMLAPAAIETVKQWKYRPYLLNGDPVNVETEIRVNFTLSGEPPAEGVAGDALGVPDINEGFFNGFPSVHAPEDAMRGLRTEKVDPVYPPLALQERVQGTVMMVVQVNTSGEVDKIGLVSGHPLLAPAAIEAVKQWKYKPYLWNGQPVEVATIVRVYFTVSSSGQGIAADAPLPPANPTGGVVSGFISSTPPSGSPLPRRVRVSEGVSQGLLSSRVNPQYPPEAREQRIQGVVVLQVRVDAEGNIADVRLISGHPALAPAAIDAVKQWKYRPNLLNNNPVEVETQVTVSFTLVE